MINAGSQSSLPVVYVQRDALLVVFRSQDAVRTVVIPMNKLIPDMKGE
jgi:hypothetical protein